MTPILFCVHIKADGTVENIKPASGEKFTLEELQGFVGGYIEMITLDDVYAMFVNEEGKLRGLPFNHLASIIASGVLMRQDLVGDVIVVPFAWLNSSKEDDERDEDAFEASGTMGWHQ